jgi:hypothetical protein
MKRHKSIITHTAEELTVVLGLAGGNESAR